MEREQLQIGGLAGVDVTLDIAGPGSRSYAFVIDWHVRLLLAAAWFCGAWLLIQVLGSSDLQQRVAPRPFAYVVWLPPALIYFLYHPTLEVLMQGRTPGKRMAGVRIVTRSGGTPSFGAILMRNIFRLVDSLPFFYLLGLLSCLRSAQRVRIGDMAAGTLLVLESSSAARFRAQHGASLAATGLESAVVELIHDVLLRWSSLAVDKRDTLARALLVRVGTSLSAARLAALNDAELHRQLSAVLAPKVHA